MKARIRRTIRPHHRPHHATFLVLGLTFLLWPSAASADVGTAFMMRTGSLMLFGNAVIGAGEGLAGASPRHTVRSSGRANGSLCRS